MSFPKARVIEFCADGQASVSCCFCGSTHRHRAWFGAVSVSQCRGDNRCRTYMLTDVYCKHYWTDLDFAVEIKTQQHSPWSDKPVLKIAAAVRDLIHGHPEPDILRGMSPKAFAEWFVSDTTEGVQS